MTSIYCANSNAKLASSDSEFLVRLYGTRSQSPHGLAIGNGLSDEIRRLNVLPNQKAFDFLSIALSVISADQFISRQAYGTTGFQRRIELTVALANPDIWSEVGGLLESILNFLTGDRWALTFEDGGERVPTRLDQKGLRKFNSIHTCNAVCLFSGGMDSFMGANQVLQSEFPLLVSRSPTGDQKCQDALSSLMGNVARFAVNDAPAFGSLSDTDREASTRGRSLLFLSLAVLCASAIRSYKNSIVPIYIPENGFIAINPPLTIRRIGANTTRTAHPYYLYLLKKLLKAVDLPSEITNLYRFDTKGEILTRAKKDAVIAEHICDTVSCGHWHRNNMQCGRCWPCLIRRSAMHRAGIDDSTCYETQNLSSIVTDKSKRVDLWAALSAIRQYDAKGRGARPYRSIRHLPRTPNLREKYLSVIDRGFEELREFLFEQGVWS